MLSEQGSSPDFHQYRRGAKTKLAHATAPTVVALDEWREKGLAEWKHYHASNLEQPVNWNWAIWVPKFGAVALATVYDLSDAKVIDSRSSALSYQSWTKPFFEFMKVWNATSANTGGLQDATIPVEAYQAFKQYVDRRVAAGEIKSKTGYGYKGAITRILKEIWDKDPLALGPGWTERTFLHDDFENDFSQREPYSAAEVRGILDLSVKFLQESSSNKAIEKRDARHVEVAAYTAVALRLGIESECLDQLLVGNVKPDPKTQTISLRYIKKRSPKKPNRAAKVEIEPVAAEGTDEFEQRNESVGSLKSAGGVLALMLGRASRFGAQPETTLWPKRLSSADFAEFTELLFDRGLRGDDGKKLQIVRTRFRVSYKTAKNVRHQGMLPLMPEDNTRTVNANHYLQSERMRPLYEQTVIDAAEQALAYALERPKVVTIAENATEQEIAEVAADLQVPPAEIAKALTGETDVWISSCRDFYNSPFDKAGSPCSKSFYGCLGCRNALITRRVLPRLLSFYSHIIQQRTVLSPWDWRNKFGTPHDQIVNEVLPRFPQTILDEARVIAQGLDAKLHLPPEMLS